MFRLVRKKKLDEFEANELTLGRMLGTLRWHISRLQNEKLILQRMLKERDETINDLRDQIKKMDDAYYALMEETENVRN